MRFVNLTGKVVHSRYAGFINPGSSANGNEESREFERILSELVEDCRKGIGVRLSKSELGAVKALMDLDSAGTSFNTSSLHPDVRRDPTGEKRARERREAAQAEEIARRQRMVSEGNAREAFINGETARKPVGPGNMEGEVFDQSSLKGGFEAILEENARIAARKASEKVSPAEILDPIGAHMAGKVGMPDPDKANHSALDEAASEMARRLDELGPARPANKDSKDNRVNGESRDKGPSADAPEPAGNAGASADAGKSDTKKQSGKPASKQAKKTASKKSK